MRLFLVVHDDLCPEFCTGVNMVESAWITLEDRNLGFCIGAHVTRPYQPRAGVVINLLTRSINSIILIHTIINV